MASDLTNDIQHLQQSVDGLSGAVNQSCWHHGDFWISTVLGVVGIVVGGYGLYYAWKAFVEAGEAKKAAKLAGQIVKFQNVGIELRELKLSSLEQNVRYAQARDALERATETLHRILSPFEHETQFQAKIERLWGTLTKARDSLKEVRPKDAKAEEEAPQAIYNAIEGYFAEINELKADLTGLFEQRTTDNFGGSNATE